MTEATLAELLGEKDYEDLRLKSILKRAEQGEFMPTFHTWLKKVNPDYNWDWRYIKYIIDHLQMLSNGDIRKLMISLPPRSGKTELCSIHFPTYFLEKNPANRVIVGTYNQTLANKLSRRIRGLSKDRFALNPERKAMEEWETLEGGGCRAVGVGGGIAGVGANLIVLDDIVRNRKDASSITVRNSTYDWYTDDIYTRMEPDSRICVLGTRWHEDDIIGRIQRNDEELDDWVIINLPAIAETDDPLGRREGEALNPDRYPIEKLLEFKHVMGRSFYALYQGRPTEQEGEIFKASWFRKNLIDRLPEWDRASWEFARFWDLAGTQNAGDYTVGVLMAKERLSKTYYVIDVVRGRWSAEVRNQKILETAARDKVKYEEMGNVRVYFEKEPGSAGKEVAKYLTKLLAGYSVKAIRVTGSKAHRAEPWSAQLEAGNVYVMKEKWLEEYIDEHCIFDNGRHDDQVDASSGAFGQLSRGSGFISIGGAILGSN